MLEEIQPVKKDEVVCRLVSRQQKQEPLDASPSGTNPLLPFLADLERMARIGMEPVHVAARLGLSWPVFLDLLNRFPENAAALERGRAMGIEEYAAALYRAGAVSGQVAAINTFLKAKGGFKGQTESNVTITVRKADKPGLSASEDVKRLDDMFARQTALMDRLATDE